MDEVTVYRRDAHELSWVLTDGSGSPAPLRDWGVTEARVAAKYSLDDSDASKVFDLACAIDFETSVVTVTLTPVALAFDGRLVVEMRLIKPSGTITVHQFELSILKDVL